jgi:hypothetical protein
MCDKNITYDAALNIAVKKVSYQYAIRGVIYLSDQSSFYLLPCKEFQLVPVANPVVYYTRYQQISLILCNINGDIGEAVGVFYARVI